MLRPWSLRLIVLCATALLISPALWLPNSVEAVPIRPFAPRFSQTARGDIIGAANTLWTCPSSDPDCASSRLPSVCSPKLFCYVSSHLITPILP